MITPERLDELKRRAVWTTGCIAFKIDRPELFDLLAIATAAHAWRTARLRCLDCNTADNASDYANAKTDLMAALDGARGGSK